MKIQLLVEFEVEDDVPSNVAKALRSSVLYTLEEQLDCVGITEDSTIDDKITGIEVTVVG